MSQPTYGRFGSTLENLAVEPDSTTLLFVEFKEKSPVFSKKRGYLTTFVYFC